MSQPSTKTSRKFWFKAGMSAALLALLFFILPWNQVRDAATRLDPLVWVAVFGLFLVGHALGAVKWRLLVNAGHGGLSLRDAVRAYFAGLFANLYLPSIVGGDVVRAALVGAATGRPEAAVLGGVADRVIDIGTMGLLIAAGALLSRDNLPGWGARAVTILLIVSAIAAAVFLPLTLRRPLKKWPRKLRRTVGRSLVALRRLSRSPESALKALALSVVIQSLFVVLNAWIGRSVGIKLPLEIWFLVWPLAKVAGLMPISLGGLAVRDGTLAALLTPFGVPFAYGAVAGLLWQTVNMAGSAFGGLVWLALGRKKLSAIGYQLSADVPSADATASHAATH